MEEHKDMDKSYSRREVAEITGIPDRRVLFYTEQPFLLASVKTNVGRGISREYDVEAIFYLLLIKELDAVGLSLGRIRTLIAYLRVSQLKGMKLFVDGEFTKERLVLVLFLNPEHHALSEASEGYREEFDVRLITGTSAEITLSADKSSQLVLNLNEIFRKARC
jgi:DNA-binding transcriptional MerR regulator